MKLSQLASHTAGSLAIQRGTVDSVVKYLRGAGLISSGGRGPGGAEMTADDKINLLLGVCGVELAIRSAEHVRLWRRLIRFDGAMKDDRFAFTRAQNVKDFFVGLITEDLNGGALDLWLKESDDSFDRFKELKAHPRHQMVLDFYVDAFGLTLTVSRTILDAKDDPAVALRRAKTESVEVRFSQTAPDPENPPSPYKPGAKLIRRLDADTIRGWGACLLDDPK